MSGTYNAPALSEILASPEALRQAADDFAEYCSSRTKNDDDMDNGIESEEDFLGLLKGCGEKPLSYYKKLCEIGVDD